MIRTAAILATTIALASPSVAQTGPAPPEVLLATARLIQAWGFNCPTVKTVVVLGQDEIGTKANAVCAVGKGLRYEVSVSNTNQCASGGICKSRVLFKGKV